MTTTVFNKYESHKIRNHFQETINISAKLFQFLFDWKELRNYLDNIDYLYIIPDDYLFDIPFATLVVNSTRDITYLIQKAAIIYVPSASFIDAEKFLNSTFKNHNKSILLSANPSFRGSTMITDKVKKCFPNTFKPIIKNKYSNKEILERFNSDIYIIIGHGSSNKKIPELSKIDFTLFNSEKGNYEIISLSLRDLDEISWSGAEMVMLIGCETATGKIYRGTGFRGIQYGFLALGAQSVLGSLWPIDYKYALEQTKDFIEFYSGGTNPAKILQTIQVNTIEKLEKNKYLMYAHPYYWGSFTYTLN